MRKNSQNCLKFIGYSYPINNQYANCVSATEISSSFLVAYASGKNVIVLKEGAFFTAVLSEHNYEVCTVCLAYCSQQIISCDISGEIIFWNLNNSEYIPLYNGKLNIVIAASYQYLKNIIGIVKALGTMTEYEKMRIHIDWYGRKEVVKGDSRVYDEAASLIQNSALQDVISLHDETKEIHDRMQEADIVGLFSSVEGLPNVICEAMYLGKPVIMSKVSDFSILVDETNGFLCEWDKLESIKNTLLQASRLSVDQLIKMGNNSKEKAIKLFSVKNVINKWIDVIN